jgi:hypothetical protein
MKENNTINAGKRKFLTRLTHGSAFVLSIGGGSSLFSDVGFSKSGMGIYSPVEVSKSGYAHPEVLADTQWVAEHLTTPKFGCMMAQGQNGAHSQEFQLRNKLEDYTQNKSNEKILFKHNYCCFPVAWYKSDTCTNYPDKTQSGGVNETTDRHLEVRKQ